MANYLNAADIKEQVSLADLLTRLGYQCLRRSGKELLYLSMLRDSDTKPSFAVNEDLNVWYDHGAGKGGNVVDFALAYWPGMEFQDLLNKILQTSQQEIVRTRPFTEFTGRRRHVVKVPHYEIEDVIELGNSPAITGYLQSRGIWNEAQGRLKEVYYYVEDQKKLRKHFFAAGWQNEFGAWEVRNKYFKGCMGHKGITFIQGNENKLSVFEGFLDYLSWLTDFPLDDSSVLVLNSLSLIAVATNMAKGFPSVDLFFDRDESGIKASLDFSKVISSAVDRSTYYDGFNDYNDKVKAQYESNAYYLSQGQDYHQSRYQSGSGFSR